jgi:hypothetical protein
VRIAGDVQFAAEINWLVEHVRWDLEEDLSRLIGDAPAHAMATWAANDGGAAQVRGRAPRPGDTRRQGLATVQGRPAHDAVFARDLHRLGGLALLAWTSWSSTVSSSRG